MRTRSLVLVVPFEDGDDRVDVKMDQIVANILEYVEEWQDVVLPDSAVTVYSGDVREVLGDWRAS